MGYYTRFDIKIYELIYNKDNIPYKFREVLGGDLGLIQDFFYEEISGTYSLEDMMNGGESYKWYNQESNMRTVSKKFPDFMFIIKGEGEDSGDIWKTYWVNGECQHETAKIVKIVFEPFDPSKFSYWKSIK